MKTTLQPLMVACALAWAQHHPVHAEEPAQPPARVLLEERFDGALTPEWFWGLGTWEAREGVLRGFESGPRRHGPVKMRKLPLKDGTVQCEFRLEGRATFAGIIFNGSQERGHIVHVVMAKERVRIVVHPRRGETRELLNVPYKLATDAWHRVEITFSGSKVSAVVDGTVFSAEDACIAEEKLTFGLGGDSGGPEGETAGALEFRKLKVTDGAAAP